MKIKQHFTLVLALIFGFIANIGLLSAQHVHEHHHETDTTHTARHILSPAGIMGDHAHSKGSLMFSYMYMGMQMDGIYEGRSEINSMNLMEQYEMTPDDMYMQMHMFGAMYAVSDRFTLMAMVPLLQKEMEHTHMGHHHQKSTMNSAGLGDIKLSVITPLFRKSGHNITLNGGLTLPTGSVNKSSGNHMGMESRMGYGMQLGSGTTDLHGLISYSGQSANWGYGSQLGGIIRLVSNSEQYRRGNSAEHSAWIARNVGTPLTATLRLNTGWQNHIHGRDNKINPAMIPTADPNCYGGFRSRIMGGLNMKLVYFLPVNGTFGFEAGLPVYQDLNGPQMGESWTILSAVRISI